MSNESNKNGCGYNILAWAGIALILLLIYFALSGGVTWLRLVLLLQVLV